MSAEEQTMAREAWRALEPYHALIYFAPEAIDGFKQIGLKGYWMGYFASRAAPLGPVPAPVVTATFYNFHPSMVARAIPDAWSFAPPGRVLAARYAAANAALSRLLGDLISSPAVAEAAELAREAALSCAVAGRAFFAAYTALSWPTKPHLVLWHAATLLREFRGDGHVVALQAWGLDGCEAHLTLAGTGNVSRANLQPYRGWSDEEWEAAHARLQARGLLNSEGILTAQGQVMRQVVENLTDTLAVPPWRALGPARHRRLLELVRPLSQRIVDQGGVPVPNPMGLPRP